MQLVITFRKFKEIMASEREKKLIKICVYRDTLDSVSEFDITTTKAEYMNKIRENIKQWKKVYKQQDDLGNIIQTIKKTSVASKISLTVNQRNSK